MIAREHPEGDDPVTLGRVRKQASRDGKTRPVFTLLRVVAGLLMALALMYAKAGAEQPPACRDMLACQQERVADLRDYTEYLQAEVAYCKATNKSLGATLTLKQREIEALKKAAPDKEPPTP